MAPGLSNYSTIMNSTRGVYDLIEEQYRSHLDTAQPDGKPRDLMDAFIAEMNAAEDPGSAFFGQRGRENMDVSIGNEDKI